MAAGTAAAIVPIRSISRRLDPASPQSITSVLKEHPRLSTEGEFEKVTFIPEAIEDAGPIWLRLITQLKGIQLGKVNDDFGWCFPITREDGIKVTGEKNGASSNGETVDQLD